MITHAFKERFFSKIKKTDDCWIWIGSLMTSGYGVMSVGHSGKISAHRASYEIAYGDFDKTLYVCHTCDNKKCVNPSHLFLGTQSDNMRDCVRKGRLKKAYKWTRENNPNTGRPMSEDKKIAMSKRKQKPFKVYAPDGTLIEQINLTQFCITHGLNQGAMWSVINGRIKQHKGYTCAN